jgi:hypothetical protein
LYKDIADSLVANITLSIGSKSSKKCPGQAIQKPDELQSNEFSVTHKNDTNTLSRFDNPAEDASMTYPGSGSGYAGITAVG